MPIRANAPYHVPAIDAEAHFHGARLVYAGWDGHLLFSCPATFALPPEMPFAAFCAGPLAAVYGQHPDFARIDWSAATWRKNGTAFTPDPALTLAANGIAHKDALRFTTPGLSGIDGAGL